MLRCVLSVRCSEVKCCAVVYWRHFASCLLVYWLHVNMHVFTLQNVPRAGCGVTYWRTLYSVPWDCHSESVWPSINVCSSLAFNPPISCSSLHVILPNTDISQEATLEAIRFRTVYYFPRLRRTASTLTAATGHFISGLTVHIKYTRSVEKFLSLHPVTFHWSSFVSCSV